MSGLHNPSFVAVPALLGLFAGLLAGCSGDLNPMRAAYGTGAAGPPAKAPDFVADSRRAGDTFLPVGVSAPARPVRAKSPEGTRALEEELLAARSRNAARARSAEGVTQGGKAP